MNDNSNIKNINENKKSKNPRKVEYFITPGLYETFDRFYVFCETRVERNLPIVLIGDTGVGKSMFTHIFENYYKNIFKAQKNVRRVWTNCADLGGPHSDSNIAHSALFGHVRGSFSGAYKDMKGLVDNADGGLLTLEEIGELPDRVQAMLLTFMETGKYNKLGSSETLHANVQVIASTNNEGNLSDAFAKRLSFFYVPALHERRKDILYYFAAKHPDLVQTLSSCEIFALLAYHWPGNVRDIDDVAFHMIEYGKFNEKRRLRNREAHYPNDLGRLFFTYQRHKSLIGIVPIIFISGISKWGGKDFLISQLNKYGLFLSDLRHWGGYPFLDLNVSAVMKMISTATIGNEIKEQLNLLEVKAISTIIKFERAYLGFEMFCGLFGQQSSKNKNIFDDMENEENFAYSSKKGKGIILCQELFSDVMKRKSELVNLIPEEVYDFWIKYEKQRKLKSSNKPSLNKIIQEDIVASRITEKQLLKAYYENLLNETGGNVKEASKIAGCKETTFRAKLDRMDVSFRRSDKLEGSLNANKCKLYNILHL